MRRDVMALPAPLTAAAVVAPAEEPPIFAREADALRIDQLQLLGSHNSYHRAPRFALTPRFRYTHRPLPQQLAEQGVRHLELDVRYAGGTLQVGHAPIVDAGTQCRSFERCLEGIAAWSRSQPGHLPVFVFVQPKEGLISAGLDQRVDLLDRAIARVFRTRELLLPRDVARQFPNLRDAVRSAGWPALEHTRGKVAFVLFGHTRLVREYARGRPRLEGRSMFVATRSAGAPYAAIMSVDDPRKRVGEIQRAVSEHILVRTRADANLVRRARRREAAIQSGAHFIGTDFVDPAEAWLDFGPDAPARQNPLSAGTGGTRRRVLELTGAAASTPAPLRTSLQRQHLRDATSPDPRVDLALPQ
jgi:hypothetical protein